MSRSIPLDYFVDLTSSAVRPALTFGRLNALVITKSNISFDQYKSFTTLDEVITVFGLTSPVTKYATTYFGYISKFATKAQKLSVYNWSTTATPSKLLSGALTDLDSIKETGAFELTFDGTTKDVNVDLQGATSFSDVATSITTALNTAFTTASFSCTYQIDSQTLIINTGVVGKSISFASTPTTGTDLSTILKLTQATGASIIDGSNVKTLVEVLAEIIKENGDWFTISYDETITIPTSDYSAAATLMNNYIGRYIFITSNTLAAYKNNVTSIEAIQKLDGFMLNGANQAQNAFVQAIIAAMDFTITDGATNVNFIAADQFKDVAVSDTTDINFMSQYRISQPYITGAFGQNLVLYGEGGVCGSVFVDLIGLAGYSWLKAQIQFAVMNLFVANANIGLRDAIGDSKVTNTVIPVLNSAVNAGVIATNVDLTAFEYNTAVSITGLTDIDARLKSTGYYFRLEPLTDEDVKTKTRKILIVYTRNTPTNRLVGRVFIIG